MYEARATGWVTTSFGLELLNATALPRLCPGQLFPNLCDQNLPKLQDGAVSTSFSVSASADGHIDICTPDEFSCFATANTVQIQCFADRVP
jgi:hypothetical protein